MKRPKGMTLGRAFNQGAFAASAMALITSHRMSDEVWRIYFPELPPSSPEFCMVLLELHPSMQDAHEAPQ